MAQASTSLVGAAVMSLPSAVVAAAAAVAGPDGNGSTGSGRRRLGEEDVDDAPTPDGHDGCVHNIARHCPPHEHPVANTTSSARIFEDADFWIYKQPIVLYNLLDARYVSHTGGAGELAQWWQAEGAASRRIGVRMGVQ